MNNNLKLFVIGYGVDYFPESICERYTDKRIDNRGILHMAKIKRSDAAFVNQKYNAVDKEYVYTHVLKEDN